MNCSSRTWLSIRSSEAISPCCSQLVAASFSCHLVAASFNYCMNMKGRPTVPNWMTRNWWRWSWGEKPILSRTAFFTAWKHPQMASRMLPLLFQTSPENSSAASLWSAMPESECVGCVCILCAPVANKGVDLLIDGHPAPNQVSSNCSSWVCASVCARSTSSCRLFTSACNWCIVAISPSIWPSAVTGRRCCGSYMSLCTRPPSPVGHQCRPFRATMSHLGSHKAHSGWFKAFIVQIHNTK